MSICLTTFQLGQIVTDAKLALSKASAKDKAGIIEAAEKSALKLVGEAAANLVLSDLRKL